MATSFHLYAMHQVRKQIEILLHSSHASSMQKKAAPLTYALLALLLGASLIECTSMKKNRSAIPESSPPLRSQPPIARATPKRLVKHGHLRVDPYFWLKERENPEVIRYLEDENTYTRTRLANTEPLQKRLFEEMKGRVKPDDTSVPFAKGNYLYYERVEKDKDHPIYCRRFINMPAGEPGKEEILLDANTLASGKEYFQLAHFEPSPNHEWAAYTVDDQGRRFYTVFFLNLKTGQISERNIPGVGSTVVWAEDNQHLFYVGKNTTTLRSDRIFRYDFLTGKSQETYFEKDETFSVGIFKPKTDRFIGIITESTLSSEVLWIDARKPLDSFRVFEPRGKKHEYMIEDGGDRIYIRTNWKAKNFRIMETTLEKTAKKHWKEVVPHRESVLMERVEAFRDFVAFEARLGGLSQIEILDRKTRKRHFIEMPDPSYLVELKDNTVFDSDRVRIEYESMNTPPSIYEYFPSSRKRVQLKQKEVLGGFDPRNYASERLWAKARDGTRVPISLVYKKNPDGGSGRAYARPLLLYAYGAYGLSLDPYFSSARLSLLDRGFIVAIAHIRGGSELGRHWYENGKMLKKMNTFYDFIDCAIYLTEKGFTSPYQLYAMGGSAGGLLMGAVINERPDLFRGVVAQVPFVDVLTTMLDSSIPLTTSEYDEWGNPNEEKYYRYIKRYSPYDRVEKKSYPNLLVTSGLHDSQVQYWEPTKWVAKLRTMNVGSNLILLHTDMNAGHGGKAGRFDSLHEVALEYAFLLQLAKPELVNEEKTPKSEQR